MKKTIIKVRELVSGYGERKILDKINLDIYDDDIIDLDLTNIPEIFTIFKATKNLI